MADASACSDNSDIPAFISVDTNKAGMNGLDRAKVDQIVYEATKGSKYYQNELVREEKISKKILEMSKVLDTVTETEKYAAERAADEHIVSIEQKRLLNRIIVHIDMDAFYASVEMRDNPELKDVPMAVGGDSMLSTSNYIARRYGVRAAMPGFIGKKLCPELVIVKPRFDEYAAVSKRISCVLAEYDPKFASVGLDEAYLDLTDYVYTLTDKEELQNTSDQSQSCTSLQSSTVLQSRSIWDYAEEITTEIRDRIYQSTQLTGSAGIASNKMLAKIASNVHKPNGQYFIKPNRDDILKFIEDLPIRKVPGIGKVTEKLLHSLNIATCKDLYEQRRALMIIFGQISAARLINISLGIGSYDVHSSDSVRKSISTERTFHETSKPKELLLKCEELCASLSEELLKEGVVGTTVTLKLKSALFQVKQYSCTLQNPICQSSELFEVAGKLLKDVLMNSTSTLRLRLMGIKLSNLKYKKSLNKQMSTLENYFVPTKRKAIKDVDLAIDTITDDALYKYDSVSLRSKSPTDNAEGVECPICHKVVSRDNVILNTHVDECLNCILLLESENEKTRINTSFHKKRTTILDYMT